ncbi:MAG: hypothetical protein JWO12_2407 [Frankiales bacterium]|nr:hypothetical protein [Frankiales bacterium]
MLVAVLVVSAGFFGFRYLVRVPRPTLVYPAGQSLESVRGNCRQGNELLGCKPEGGPRSFLTVHAPGEPRSTVQKMFDGLLAHGWSKRAAGRTAHDFLEGGAPEDLQPLYCHAGRGCVGLFRFVSEGYVLAWFA